MIHEKGGHDSKSNTNKLKKIADTQSIIRKKFKKAYANRLEREHEVNQVMKPLIEPSTSTKKYDMQPQHRQIHAKNDSKRSVKYKLAISNEPNDLCNRLRIISASSNAVVDVKHTEEKNAIITRLRELNLLL